MKISLTTLNDAVAYQLESMYQAEKKLAKGLSGQASKVKSSGLKAELKKYIESAQDKRIKLKRIFSYLLSGPYKRKNPVIDALLDQIREQKRISGSPRLRDVMIIASMQEIFHYKIAVYQSALMLVEQMEMATVPDLLAEILKWEIEASQRFSKLSVSEVNRKAKDLNLPAL